MASKTTYSKTTVSRTAARPPYRPQPEIDEPAQPLPEEEGYPDEGYPEGESPRPEENQVIPVKTVGQEQLERSREMQSMGIDNWMAAHAEAANELPYDSAPRAVAGVVPLER